MSKFLGFAGILFLIFCIYNSFEPIGSVFNGLDKQNEQTWSGAVINESKSDQPDLFAAYLAEITTMVGDGSQYPPGYKLEELNKARGRTSALRSKNTKAFDWVERGPSNVPGRTRGLVIHPEDPTGRTWLAGSAGGGIWKTEDGGLSWTNKTPDLPNLSTTVVALSESNPDIVYAGTGEGFFNSGAITGDGIFKSVDGGETWQQLASTASTVDFRNINRIIVDPGNANIVLACTNGFPPFTSGIYKSTDGGLSWTNVFKATSRVQQIVAHPSDFNVQYASINGQGILRSVDAGDSWAGLGLGLATNGRIELAIAPTNPQRLFAAVEGGNSGSSSDVFMSDDGGLTWMVLGEESGAGAPDWLGEQGWYDNSILVHPFNEDIVYVGGIDIFKAEVKNTTRELPPRVTGVTEDGTAVFMDFINAGLSYLRGGLGTSTEWFEDHAGFPIEYSDLLLTSVEIRFGPGIGQKAHRFTVPVTSGAGSDGGAGVVPTDHIYQDYVDVPFEVWDVDNNRQLMVSFRDQERDGKWNLIERSEIDPVPGREYIFVQNIDYNDSADPNVAEPGGHAFKTIYCTWPTLAAGGQFDAGNLPASQLVISHGTVEEQLMDSERLTNSGGVFNLASTKVHPDIHNIQTFSTQQGLFRFIVATDGGIYTSDEKTDPGEGANDWTRSGNGYNTAQFYGIDKRAGQNNYVGGTQDNGTWVTREAQPSNLTPYAQAFGGDGFEVVWSYQEPTLVMASAQFNRFRRSTDGGLNWLTATQGLEDTGDEKAPFFSRLSSHPAVPRVVLGVGNQGVWRTNNFGETWFVLPIAQKWITEEGSVSSAHRVEFSLADRNIIWAGGGMTSQRNLHVSTNGGASFQEVPNIADTIGSISGLATHPIEAQTAFVLLSFPDYGKIFRTTDLGSTWVDISGFNGGEESTNGFPDVVVNTLIVLPHDPETLWVGTQIGIFESNDDGLSWHYLDSDLPAVSVYELKAVDDQILAATHGRGLWTLSIPGLQWPGDLVAGISPDKEVDFQIFPNPASDFITVRLSNAQPSLAKLSITNTKGQLILTDEFGVTGEQSSRRISTRSLKEGMYIVRVKSDQMEVSRRLVIRR